MAHPYFGVAYYLGGGNLDQATAWNWSVKPPGLYVPTVPEAGDAVYFAVGDAAMSGNLVCGPASFTGGSYALTGSMMTGYLSMNTGVHFTMDANLAIITAMQGEALDGTFVQTGGLNTVFSNLFALGGGGSYTLGGGSATALLAADNVWEYIGYPGAGTFVQNARSVNSAAGLQVLSGRYNLNDGKLNVGGGGIYVGVGSVMSTLSVNASAGAQPWVVDAGDLTVGYQTPQANTARLQVSGSASPIVQAQNAYVGVGGFGAVDQQSGRVYLTGALKLGGRAADGTGGPGNGSYTIGNGASLYVDHDLVVGEAEGCTGTLVMSGPIQASASIYVGPVYQPPGSVPVTMTVGLRGNGEVRQEFGSVNVHGNLVIGDACTGRYTIEATSAQLLVSGQNQITLGARAGGSGVLELYNLSAIPGNVLVMTNDLDVGPNGTGGSQVILHGGARIRVFDQLTLHAGCVVDVRNGAMSVGLSVGLGESGSIAVNDFGKVVGAGTIVGDLQAWSKAPIIARGGTLKVSGFVASDAGVAVEARATFEVGGKLYASVTFQGGAGTTLKFDADNTFLHDTYNAGTIRGFSQGNLIDLAWAGPAASLSLNWVASDGKLHVLNASTGHEVAVLKLAGPHTADEFLLAGDGHGGTVIYDQRSTGKLHDGPIAGATIFVDVNGNGELDAGETSTSTDATGAFSLVASAGTLVASGGTDLYTALASPFQLSAALDSRVISPLTTLLLAVQGLGQDPASALQATLAALRLDASIDLQSFDPLDAAAGGDATGVGVLRADAEVIDTIALMTASLASLGAQAGASVRASFAALAHAVVAAAGTPIDLGNASTAAALITDAAAALSVGGSAAFTSFGAIIAAGNAALVAAFPVDTTASAWLANLAAIERAEQGAAADSLRAAGGNDALLASAVTAFTGAGLASAIANAATQVPLTVVIADDTTGTAIGDVTYALNFTRPVMGLTPASFSVVNGAVSSVTGAASSFSVVVTPNSGAEGSLEFRLVNGGVSDLTGHANAAAAAQSQLFDTRPPTIAAFSPPDGALGVPASSDLVLSFSEPIRAGTGNLVLRTADGTVVDTYDIATSAQLTITDNRLTVHPVVPLVAGAGYRLDLDAGSVLDLPGNAFAGTTAYDITAMPGSRHVVGTAGDDTLVGGGGADTLTGAGGNDVFWYGTPATGADRIDDFAPGDTIRVIGATLASPVQGGDGANLAANSVEVATGTSTTTVRIGTDAIAGADITILLDGVFAPGRFVVSGTDLRLDSPPTGGVFVGGTPAQGQTLSASNTLADIDGLGAIGYQWLADGTPIGGATGSTLVLTQAQVGKTISVTASYTDGFGSAQSKTSAATAAVANVNDAPTASGATRSTPEDVQLTGVLPPATDLDGDAITYAAMSQPMHGTLLVQANGGFTYTPAADYHGTDGFTFSVSDTHGGSNTYAVDLTVISVNDAPVLAHALADQAATVGAVFAYTVAVDTFSDVDGDTLSYAATLAGGQVLPSWLSFAPATRAFSGTPTAGAVGTVTVRVTVSDPSSLTASDEFNLVVSVPGQVITGTVAADTLTGGPGADTISGLAGDDLLKGLGGDDWLDGGPGRDTALYSGARALYSAHRLGNGDLTVTGPEGTDTLHSVERAVFTDLALGFDTDGTGGQSYRLYQAAFDRLPDAGGLGFWMYYLDRGFDFVAAANAFLNSDEFRAMYGPNPANEQFVTLLYTHVMHRVPDAGGNQFWIDAMANKDGAFGHAFTKGEVLVAFSESAENKANVVGVIEDGFEYQPYQP